MKLVTKELLETLPKFESTDGMDIRPVKIKFFHPLSNWRWYAVEGELQSNGDVLFFGLVEGFEKEWGYFSLSELQSVQGDAVVERDLYFNNYSITTDGTLIKSN